MNVHDPNENELDDLLQRSVNAMRDAAIPDGPPQDLMARTSAVLKGAAREPTSFNLLQRIKAMKTINKIAASLLLACGLAALAAVLFHNGSPAWADVVKAVAEAKSLSYTITTKPAGDLPPFTVKFLTTADGRQRAEGPHGMLHIVDARAGKMLMLNTQQRTAILADFKGNREGIADPIDAFRKMRDKDAKDLGEREIEGRKVKGFVTTAAGPELTVWADASTGMPVRIDMKLHAGGAEATSVIGDFVVDPKFDESAFSLAVPQGYKEVAQPNVKNLMLGASADPESNVVGALRGYAERSNGRFPAKLDDWAAYAKLITTDKPTEKDYELLGRVGGLTPFLVMLPKDHWAYLGDGATLGDKDKLIFWYRKPNTDSYRAVYGDLTFKDVKPADIK
jgi:outer membrane lipoprotein-sorting protein